MLKPENRAAIDKTLANLRDLTGGLNQRMAELDRTLTAVQGAADGMDRAGQQRAPTWRTAPDRTCVRHCNRRSGR